MEYDLFTMKMRDAQMRSFKSYREVEERINLLAKLADREADIRDTLEWESPEYWKAHDRYINFVEAARLLMPKGS